MADTFQVTVICESGASIEVIVNDVDHDIREESLVLAKEAADDLRIGLHALWRVRHGGEEPKDLAVRKKKGAAEFVDLMLTAFNLAEKIIKAPHLARELEAAMIEVRKYANQRGYSLTPRGAAFGFAASILEEMMCGKMPPRGSGPGVAREYPVTVTVGTRAAKAFVHVHVAEDGKKATIDYDMSPRTLARQLEK